MSTTVCVECTSEVPADADFCPECGFLAHSDHTSCPECLNPVLLALDACPECGFPLDELRQERAAAQQAAAKAGDSGSPAKAAAGGRAASVGPGPGRGGQGADAAEGVANEVLQAQIESFNELTVVIGKMVDNSSGAAINELMVNIRNFLNSAENTNNDMLSDLITNIGRFVEGSEKIKDDMLNSMKEQNLIALSSMQEIVTSFSKEAKTAAAGLQEAQKAAIAEMNGVSQQLKAKAAREAGGPPYILYLCAVLTIFSILNFFVTAYVVRLVK